MPSKKIRFEVFKRDSFRCQYCGKAPPEVSLEVDHINPRSMGGTDDINNLISACFSCNRGKAAIGLGTVPNSLKMNLEILKEKEIQISEYNKFLKAIKKREDLQIRQVDRHFDKLTARTFKTQFKDATLRKFIRSLPADEVIDALNITFQKFDVENVETAVRYFCGVCWRKIKRGAGDGW